MAGTTRPWAALWTLIIGFFMILIDSTVVTVATPQIMEGLDTDTTGAVWVTSAYLLAFATPLLLAGRLGDRFGQRRIYLIGLALFTVASLVCGLAPSLAILIAARVGQGVGAALITPQTLAIVTRIFPADRRGSAMAVWGSVAGIASVVGPIVGGALVSSAGWPWVFFVNLPVGVVGFVLALILVPHLPAASRGFDLPGVVLSAAGLLGLVFGIQEISAPHRLIAWLPAPVAIAAGIVLLAAFVAREARTRGEALLPLTLFRIRNFVLGSVGITTMGFAITCMSLPVMIFAQAVLRLTALQSALVMVPMAVIMIAAARPIGRLVDRVEARVLATGGFAAMIGAMVWMALAIPSATTGWNLVAPFVLVGIGSSFIAAPLTTAAMRDIPPELAGAGSGAFNALRQIGAAVGAAAVAAALEALIDVHPAGHGAAGAGSWYAAALGETVLLPAAVLVLGLATAIFLRRVTPPRTTTAPAPMRGPADDAV